MHQYQAPASGAPDFFHGARNLCKFGHSCREDDSPALTRRVAQQGKVVGVPGGNLDVGRIKLTYQVNAALVEHRGGKADACFPAVRSNLAVLLIRKLGLAALGTHRAITIFRGKAFDRAVDKNDATDPEIQLAYGMDRLPKFTTTFNFAQNTWNTGSWDLVANNMGGVRPLFGSYNPIGLPPLVFADYGSAGFDNIFNNYTWIMAVYKGQLYVGTMDFAFLLAGLTDQIDLGGFDLPDWLAISGSDLYRIASSSADAVPESIDGMENFANYGIRTVISDDALYLGTANPINLLQDGDGKNMGGWELLKLLDPDMPVSSVDPSDAGIQPPEGPPV